MRAVKTRILEHRSRIKNGVMEAPMVSHFKDMGHSHNDLCYVILKRFQSHPFNRINVEKSLLQMEAFVIYKFKTIGAMGLNTELELNSYF